MANLILPGVGESTLILHMLLHTIPTGNQVLKIYENSVTLTDSTVLSDLTECTLTGYSAITLLRSDWTVATDTGLTRATNLQKSFIFSQVGTVFGFYVVDSTGALLWTQPFDAPTFTSVSTPLQITPSIGLL